VILNLDVFSSRIAPHTGSLGIVSPLTSHNSERVEVCFLLIMINGKSIKKYKHKKEKGRERRIDVKAC
jgi:hypothetical protein